MFILSKKYRTLGWNFHLLILFLTHGSVSNDNQVELSSLDWIIGDGYNEAILEVTFNGKILTVPLQKAPFCRLTITHKCDCFVLRRDQNTSNWDVGSFVYCDGKVHGEFMNSTDYFVIAPSKDSKSREHQVTKLGSPEEPFEMDTDIKFKYRIPDRKIDFHYFEPLTDPYPLANNETGYIKCFFAVDENIISTLPEGNIEIFLQNLVNKANKYYLEFDIILIYCGWTLASREHTLDDTGILENFIYEGYKLYDEEQVYHSITLLTPTLYLRYDNVSNTTTVASGFAWPDSMCTPWRYGNYVYYLIWRNNIANRNQLRTFIHEIGHQFGFKHTEETECDGKEPNNVVWVMRRKSPIYSGSLEWSECTIKYMWENRYKRPCMRLEDNPYQPFCGDGQVDKGEECDCISEKCRKCCNKNCSLTIGSKCSHGQCCDTSTCTFAKGVQCRAAQDSCDIPELCDGTSSRCPSNYAVANGYRCGRAPARGFCFNGRCGSHQDVCRWIYIYGNKGGDKCYDSNVSPDTTIYGGCGTLMAESGENNFKCEEKDKFCGKIWCTFNTTLKNNLTEKFYPLKNSFFPVLDLESVLVDEWPCWTIYIVDRFWMTTDPAYVQNGSECGDGKMCVKQKCVPLPSGCPENCSGTRIVHPYTKEEFPAFILSDPRPDPPPHPKPDPDDNGDGGGSIWYIIVGIVLLLIISSIAGIIAKKKISSKKTQSR